MNKATRLTLALALQTAAAVCADAAIGTWKAYNAYKEVQKIVAAGSGRLFVRASDRLYMYNTGDGAITTFDKINSLHDTNVKDIEWNSAAGKLVVVYDNSNIDMVGTDGNATNISDLYDKNMVEDKTVNSMKSNGRYTYLATNFGIVKLDAAKEDINETYYLNGKIQKIGFAANSVYALDADGKVHMGSLSDNLIDKSNWTVVTEYSGSLFADDNSDWEKYYSTVEKLNPDGPDYNRFFFVKVFGNKLYSTGGIYSSTTDGGKTGTAQVWDGNEWQNYQQDGIEEATGHHYWDMDCIANDTRRTDTDHTFVGGKSGLYEFENGKFKQGFNLNNSPLLSPLSMMDYVIVNGMTFDSEGNLWLFNSKSPSTSLFEYTGDGQWVGHHKEEFMYNNKSLENAVNMFFDSRGLLWFCNEHWRQPSVAYYNKATDKAKIYTDFTNQDGVRYSPISVYCAAEDREGNVWVGTSTGLFYLSAQDITDGNDVFNQYKVARNDGTNNADYLLTGVSIKSMAIDGGNRKWIGTSSSGVYLISADNNTQIAHYTTDNSGLASNSINSIAINGKTGEVFFATENGLCSYTSDATEPVEEMDKDNVYAYPNPVTPEYTGLITIVGLSYNADVKITTATGHPVAEGRSTGGTFTWDGHDRDGKRVASGVYNVMTAKQDGSKGTVCKVAVIN